MEGTASLNGSSPLARDWLNRRARNRAVIRRLAITLASLCAALIVWKLVTKMWWPNTATDRLLRNTRKPALFLEAAILVSILTFDRPWRLLEVIWSDWNRRQRTMFAAVILNVLAGIFYMLNYPEHLIENYHGAITDARPSLRKIVGQDSVPVEGFAAKCCDELPGDARILYHGAQEGWLFAHEVHPRRVFILPSEGAELSSTWHKNRWLSKLPADPLNGYWDHPIAASAEERRNFIRSHGITHEVFYDAADSTHCRCEAIQ